MAGVVDGLSKVDAFGGKVVRRAGIFERGTVADLVSADPGRGGTGSWETDASEVEEAPRGDLRICGRDFATPRQVARFLSTLEAVEITEACEGFRARVWGGVLVGALRAVCLGVAGATLLTEVVKLASVERLRSETEISDFWDVVFFRVTLGYLRPRGISL